ncbi:carbohydrate kinase [Thiomicrorhabdus immobilis]|uniref:Carbohydrate kinase n=1 Tax=Thiomicrorhabdus immobilis TaxID=2791037 RepID=A0ABM7MDA8_9GAMM|nr:FGGY-family carbohydrate kinase [Thiomicrorhabdus immobilis]BCN93395.1 carbohydrate kinase [Thiomicrorhabdus immobilis]
MNPQDKPPILEPSQPSLSDKKVILGIDIGTSGVRACIVEKNYPSSDSSENMLFEAHIEMPVAEIRSTNGLNTLEISQNPQIWIDTLESLLKKIGHNFPIKQITHLVLDATSSTVLLVDQSGHAYTDALMYNDAQSVLPAKVIAGLIEQSAEFSGAQGASSTLAKVATLLEQNPNLSKPIICHQIDFINHYLSGALNITDENNALKLGYNSIHQAWPNWIEKYLKTLNSTIQLPQVVKPGSFIAMIAPHIAERFGFRKNLKVMAGTTDSIAGFLASGASQIGDAVSSLGSTLAIKAISDKPLFDKRFGLYSHRLGNNWLVGGASNSGGRVLLNHYNLADLVHIVKSINNKDIEDFLKTPRQNYYPLSQAGERFPIADANLPPKMPKSPQCAVADIDGNQQCLQAHQTFLLNVLTGMTEIERLAYHKLVELHLPPVKKIFSVGGGTQNHVWMQLREKLIDAQFLHPEHQQAAYGVTKLID